MEVELLLRIFVAAILGGLIGLEREYRAKEAGFRTHFLVAMGSALFMIVSAYGFSDAMNDDLQTPVVVSLLFEACHQVNLLVDRKQKISAADLEQLSKVMHLWTEEILGLKTDDDRQAAGGAMDKVMQMVLDMRAKAKAEKDWTTSDKIRDNLNEAGIIVKDTPDGAVWEM